jgi:hypothetical protein
LIFYYLCAIYLLLALLVWWVPACDFDTMTSYLTRIPLERIGPLREVGTLELQYLFPKFFDYLHAPLLDWGWFTTLPNFALFTAVVIAVIWRFPTAMAVRFILGLAICSPVLATVTSAKNDVTLGLIGLLCWFWIYYADVERPWYLPVAMLLAAALVGTKWHGLVLAPAFGFMAGIRVVRERALRWAPILLSITALPFAWYVSSADVYLENLQHEGAICPPPDFLKQPVRVGRNVWSFGTNQVLETFEIPFYCADAYLHTKMWPLLKRVTKGGKAWNYTVMPNSQLAVFGLPLLLTLAASLAALCIRRVPSHVRACALLSVYYCAVLLTCFDYSTWINRYFLPTYLFGLVAAAFLTQRIALRGICKPAFYAYLIFVSLQSALLNAEKRVFSFNMYIADADRFESYATIFAHKFDRDALYFHIWTGYLPPYRIWQERVHSHNRVLIVNTKTGNDVPFLYPFVRGRSGYNTRVVNLRRGQAIPSELQEFDFILAFPGDFSPPGFTALFQHPEIVLYERARPAAGDKAGTPDSAQAASAAEPELGSLCHCL